MNEPTNPNDDPNGSAPDTGALPKQFVGVWPPPVDDGRPELSAPFKFVYRRLTGNLSDVREGNVSLSEKGFLIDGRAMPRAEIYSPIVIFLFLFSLLLAIIAHLVMRYGFLQPMRLLVPWSDISEIVLVPKKRWIGLSYVAPNFRGAIKKFCFCFELKQDEYDAFEQIARHYAPQITAPGTLKSGTSLGVIILLLLLLALAIVGIIAIAAHPSTAGAHE
jgi:hypothetical protein